MARAYAAWRRRLEEETLRYDRQRGHMCADASARRVTIDTGARLYGCLDCGRSHVCQPPDYGTCPRIVAVGAADLVCAFSGTVVGEPSHVMGYALECHRRQTRREFLGSKSQVLVVGGSARRLRHQANAAASGAKRRRLNKAADSLVALQKSTYDVLAFEHYATRLDDQGKRKRDDIAPSHGGGGDDMDSMDDDHRLSYANDHDHDNNNNNNIINDGDGDDSSDDGGLRPRTGGDYDLIMGDLDQTTADTQRDDTFMAAYLAPVLERARAWAPAFDPLPPPPPLLPSSAAVAYDGSSTSTSTSTSISISSSNGVDSATSPDSWALLWPLLPTVPTSDRLLVHQLVLIRAAPRYQDAVLMDRLMALYAWVNGHTGPPATESASQRTATALLGHLLTRDFYLRDHTGLLVPIWLPDGHLKLTRGTDTLAERYWSVLTTLPWAPMRLRAFLFAA